MGVTAGVPSRVDAGVKAGLLDLVDSALEQGWTLVPCWSSTGADAAAGSTAEAQAASRTALRHISSPPL